MLDSVLSRNGFAFGGFGASRMFGICAIRFNLTRGCHLNTTIILLT